MDDSKKEHDRRAGEGGGIEIEASWAPQDPRDRLYDSTASKGEKTASLVRILAAFHPVLNSVVLTYDLFRRLGPVKSTLVITPVLGLIIYLILQ